MLALTLVAQPSPEERAEKKPWELSLDERVQARFGAEARSRRIAARGGDIIEGRRDPSLFFPTELFDSFVTSVYVAPSGDRMRQYITAHSTDLFQQASDWAALDPLVGRYVEEIKRERELLRSTGIGRDGERTRTPELMEVQRKKRSLEAASLREARKHFGAQRFDRFLYTIIAPRRTIQVTHITSEAQRSLVAREKAAQ